MTEMPYKVGDWIVYVATKASTHPGPRAENIDPAPLGEQYIYTVEKYWVVDEIHSDGHLTARTRTGKKRRISLTDPALRHASWLDRLLRHERFPKR